MNVYQKLLQARIKLQETELKKSGQNTHLKFSYMELEDFLPTINKINMELGLFTAFSLNGVSAMMTVTDVDKPEDSIMFESPVAVAKLQGNASPIQELGAQHTYLRRYMYLMTYEICEHDALDASIGKPVQQNKPSGNTNSQSSQKNPSETQQKAIMSLAKSKGKHADDIKAVMKELSFPESLKELSMAQYTVLVKTFEKFESVVK